MVVSVVLKQNLRNDKCQPFEYDDYQISILETIFGGKPNCEIAKDFLDVIGQKFTDLIKLKLRIL